MRRNHDGKTFRDPPGHPQESTRAIDRAQFVEAVDGQHAVVDIAEDDGEILDLDHRVPPAGAAAQAGSRVRVARRFAGRSTSGAQASRPRVVPSLLAPEIRHPQTGNALYVFALPDAAN